MKKLSKYIDHTLLKADATASQIETLCQQAKQYDFASVCVNGRFVKTSTGFSKAGATVEDVKLMRQTVGDACQVKAAGGIRNYSDAIKMIEAGADRLGCSASIAIVEESEK